MKAGNKVVAIAMLVRTLVYVAATAVFLVGGAAHAAGGGSDGGVQADDSYGKAQIALSQEDYAQAIEDLREALADSPRDADVLNLLGFSHRKIGETDQAFDYYQQALAIDPNHRGANEYLGELYLETDQLANAEKRLEVLNGACFFGCLEHDELKEAIEKYRIAKGL